MRIPPAEIVDLDWNREEMIELEIKYVVKSDGEITGTKTNML